jgi:hypothetical protein
MRTSLFAAAGAVAGPCLGYEAGALGLCMALHWNGSTCGWVAAHVAGPAGRSHDSLDTPHGRVAPPGAHPGVEQRSRVCWELAEDLRWTSANAAHATRTTT